MFWKQLAACVFLVLGVVLGTELLAGPKMDCEVRAALYKAAVVVLLGATIWTSRRSRSTSRRIAKLKASAAAWMTVTEERGAEPERLESPFADDEFSEIAAAIESAGAGMRSRIEAVETQRRDLLALLESIPEGVVAIDAQQKILFANASAYRLFGLSSRRIEGQRIWEVLRHPGLLDTVKEALENSDGHNVEIEMHGPQRFLSFHSRGLSVGPPGSIIVVLNDVTDLRRLERVRQEFLANVSHELKTPLASIKAYTETLLEHDLDDRKIQIRFLRRIEEQAERLHALVIDMLTIARLEARDPLFDIHSVDLHPIVRSCVDAFHNGAAAKQIALRSILPANEFTVLADAEGLNTILRNLIDNAIKYTPGNGKVEVSTERDGDVVAIHVTDTGAGIPKADQARIFERFYRVDKARSRELGGTGLGLSIVKHLVQAFNGAISVQSEVHKGSQFTVRLPIETFRPSESAHPPNRLVQTKAVAAAATVSGQLSKEGIS